MHHHCVSIFQICQWYKGFSSVTLMVFVSTGQMTSSKGFFPWSSPPTWVLRTTFSCCVFFSPGLSWEDNNFNWCDTFPKLSSIQCSWGRWISCLQREKLQLKTEQLISKVQRDENDRSSMEVRGAISQVFYINILLIAVRPLTPSFYFPAQLLLWPHGSETTRNICKKITRWVRRVESALSTRQHLVVFCDGLSGDWRIGCSHSHTVVCVCVRLSSFPPHLSCTRHICATGFPVYSPTSNKHMCGVVAIGNFHATWNGQRDGCL